MDRRSWRVLTALLVGFVLGFTLSLANGQSVPVALYGGLVLTAVAGLLATLLLWTVEIAEKKGYSGWIGMLAALLLNVPGLLLLAILPSRRARKRG